MPRLVELPISVRCLKKPYPDCHILCQTKFFIKSGQQVALQEPETLSYDHRDQTAFPFLATDNNIYYLLLPEIGLPLSDLILQ